MSGHARRPPRSAAGKPPAAGRTIQDALAAFQSGRLAECISLCTGILAQAPRNAAALHLMGAAQLRLGAAAEAVSALERAVQIEPGNAEVHSNLGAAQRGAGSPAKAAASFRRAIALRPAFAPARFNLGNALADLNRHGEAEAAYRDTLAIDPDHAGAHNNLGLALLAQARGDEAERHFRAALALRPAQRDGHLNLARLLLDRGADADALAHFEAALAAAPDDPTLLSERAVALLALGRPQDAVASAERAVRLAPDAPAFRLNLGSALCASGQAQAALAYFVEADVLSPGDAAVLANYGHAYKQLGRLDAAVAQYDRALAVDPANREARFGRGFCRLLTGDFARGWADYRARESMAAAGPEFRREPLPHDLSGRRVLVRHDQGLGDEIFFLRFLPALRRRGATVAYLPDPRLAAMLGRAGIAIADAESAGAGWDDIVSVGDLPFLLGAADTPASIALRPLADRAAALAARLAAFGPPPYLGVAWRAGTRNARNMLYKEAPAARLAAALRSCDARIVAVQRAAEPGEAAAFAAGLGRPILDLGALNDDLEAMLALTGLLDQLVCVSNTNVHLAAAQGRACRILLPHPPEFRWMAAGAESPWFPGTRLYRQAADGRWDDAFASLAADLAGAFPAGF